MGRKRPPSDHFAFPDPDSVLARRVSEERRRPPFVVAYRLAWSPTEEVKTKSAPARHGRKSRNPGWLDSPKARKKFQEEHERLEEKVLIILEEATTRRVRTEVLASRSREVTLRLLETRRVHEWHQENEKAPGFTLVAKLKAARRALRAAERRWDKLPKGPHRAPNPRALKAQAARLFASLNLKIATDDLFAFRSGGMSPRERTDELRTKHRVDPGHGAIYEILHHLHHDYGIPNATISQLLKAASLPVLTPRNIKRVLLSFRRP